MADTPSPSLGFNEIATGAYQDLWGGVLNTQVTALVDEAIAGFANINLPNTTDYTLTATNYASNQARRPFLYINGNPGGTTRVIIPGVSKVYIVLNATSPGQVIDLYNGTNTIALQSGVFYIVITDGTNFYYTPINPGSGFASPGTVFYSNTDTTADYLSAKLIIGAGLQSLEANPGGGNQNLTLSSPAADLFNFYNVV